MSLFRHKQEDGDGRDKQPPPLPAQESEPNEQVEAMENRHGSGSEPRTTKIASPVGAVELVNPGEYLHGRVNLIARAPDTRSTQMTFEIAAAGSDRWRALGTARAPFHLPFDTRQLVDGIYELRIESLTVGGQSASSRRFGPYTIDNTPPSVAIAQPHGDETVQGWVELVAEAGDDTSGVARVELSYAESGEWRPLAELEPQDGEVRGFWQTDDCVPGACRLRATAFDRAGNEASDVIAVTIAQKPPQSEPAPAGATRAPAPEPARGTPSSPCPPSPEAAGRFGRVPSWDWERPARAESAESEAESAPSESVAEQEPEQISVEPETSRADVHEQSPQSVSKGVAWHWQASQAIGESEPEPKPEPEPKSRPEPEPELESEAPEATVHLVEPLSAEERDEDEEGRDKDETTIEEQGEKPAAESGSEGEGSVVGFPRGTRGWNIWELSELVDGTPGQDPAREEERRQILYHLREHTAVDGRIPPKFEGLILEIFGELMPGDSRA